MKNTLVFFAVFVVAFAVIFVPLVRNVPVLVRWVHSHRAIKVETQVDNLQKAEKALSEGSAEKALHLMHNIEIRNSNRGCWITMMQAAAGCMIDGDYESAKQFTALGRYTSRVQSCSDFPGKIESYCRYIKRYKDAAAAAKFLEFIVYMDNWASPRADIQLLQAKYYVESENLKKAAILCQRLWDEGEANNRDWSGVDDDIKFLQELTALRNLSGESDEVWLKACELQPFPDEFIICLQPVGKVNKKLLKDVSLKVEEFFGSHTVIMDPLPLLKENLSYSEKTDNYNADILRPNLMKELRIPENAFSVVMITEEEIRTRYFGWIYSQSIYCSHLISYNKWLKWNYHWQVVTLGNVVVGSISSQLKLYGTFPCITAGSGNMDAMRRAKFAYSPEIQGLYKNIDLVAAQRKAIADYKGWGAVVIDRK